jgi:hypothetical protein
MITIGGMDAFMKSAMKPATVKSSPSTEPAAATNNQ